MYILLFLGHECILVAQETILVTQEHKGTLLRRRIIYGVTGI